MGSQPRNHLTEADRAFWQSYARAIQPLSGRPTAAAPQPSAAPEAPPRSTGMAARVGHATLAPLVIGTQPGGVDSANWHRFRTGRLRATRVLDLHGKTAQGGFLSFATFLRIAQAEAARCVEVVTGQGGVLRRELPLWLNLPEIRSIVLAAAHPHAANPGAVRLLLRRTR